MHDIDYIKKNPEDFDLQMNNRNAPSISGEIIKLDEVKRKHIQLIQDYQQDRNRLSKMIGKERKLKNDTSNIEKEVNLLKEKINTEEKVLIDINKKLDNILYNLPNLADKHVPEGKNEKCNKEVFKTKLVEKDKVSLSHEKFGKILNMLHFDSAADISGSRFVILTSKLARLERALINFMIDLHVKEHGYIEVSTPHIVKRSSLIGTGQLPKFEEDLYKISEDKWLIPTAEVTLTNLNRKSNLSSKELPIRYVAATNCFRSEAGASGLDTKGMIRLHEFKKVELVSLVDENSSEIELERLTNCAKKVLDLLKLPYRVMLLSTGDMGFSASKTYDLEVWVPSQKKYREISSCSNCRSFQARRMNSKYKDKEGKNKFLHTLNGSGLAVGRTLLAIMENYQIDEKKFIIPDVLVHYMNGEKEISI